MISYKRGKIKTRHRTLGLGKSGYKYNVNRNPPKKRKRKGNEIYFKISIAAIHDMPSIVFRIIYGLYKTHRKASHKAETGKCDVTSYHTCDDQAYRANGNEYVQEKWRMKKMCFMDRMSRIKMMLLEPRSDQVLLQFYQLAALLLDLRIFPLLPPRLALLRHYKLA
jgi:hypothetical protein